MTPYSEETSGNEGQFKVSQGGSEGSHRSTTYIENWSMSYDKTYNPHPSLTQPSGTGEIHSTYLEGKTDTNY